MSWKVHMIEGAAPPAVVDVLRTEALTAETPARVILGNGDRVVDTYQRNALVKGLANWSDAAKEAFNSLLPLLETEIDREFPLDFTGWSMTQLLAYHGEQRGSVPWHFDEDMWARDLDEHRKIAMVMFLGGKFEGGRFEFAHIPHIEQKSGTILLFPIWVRHRVTPVTEGVRTSLVSWRAGPRWR